MVLPNNVLTLKSPCTIQEFICAAAAPSLKNMNVTFLDEYWIDLDEGKRTVRTTLLKTPTEARCVWGRGLRERSPNV